MDNIRNFSIIAHIDHGKSTLADRFLELTGTISKDRIIPQFLDRMDLEREKGITIKMKPVRMSYNFNGQNYILNLIDTPGHVDFSYEVSRSLAAVEGAILLVDATKGIQAQTLANLELAKKQNLVVIPVINKIDLEYAKIEETKKELAALLNIDESEIIQISAKNGVNIEKVLEAIIKKIPPPLKDNILNPFRALIFDSKYDPYKGVIAYIRVIDGEVKKGLKIKFLAAKEKAEVKEVGYFNPEFSPQEKISAGEIGYIITGIKDLSMIKVGDTIIEENNFTSLPFPGYREAKPMIFISLYPQRSNDFDLLKEALLKLKLNDPALVFEQETKEALGRGFRCGFLGGLHAEIISERLSREFGLDLIISTPSVVYKIIDKKNKERFIYSASDWPNPSEIQSIEEPWVLLEIITPIVYSAKIPSFR
jgi:GTP-binding protein LepA